MNSSQETTNLCDVKYKIIFLGEMTVGKSSIIEMFTQGIIDPRYNNTVGIDFTAKNIVYNESTYRLQLWDTAGQQRFRSLIPAYMKDAHCAVITFDLSKKQTLQKCRTWLKIWNEYKKEDAICLLVGNKLDLPREIQYESGLAFAEKLGKGEMGYCEVSAKTGSGISKLFENIIDNIFIAKNSAAKQKKSNSEGSGSESRMNKKAKIDFQNQNKSRECVCCYI